MSVEPLGLLELQVLLSGPLGMFEDLIDQRCDPERRAASQGGQVAQLGHRAATDDS